jgi:hypothetical protein
MSGEQNCRKQKLKESDISPKNSLNFLAYNRLDFLDISCLHFVTIALDFDQIEPNASPFWLKNALSRS